MNPSIANLAQEAEASPSIAKLAQLAQEGEASPSIANSSEEAEASPSIANLKQEAADEYNVLLQNFKVGVIGSHYLLLDHGSEKASKLRGLILGRAPETGATYSELWLGRLQYEVDFEKVEYDVKEGKVVKVNKTTILNNDELLNKLFRSLLVILEHRDPLEKEKFYNTGNAASTYNKHAIRALFHVGKNKKEVSMKDVVLDYTLRSKLVDVCLQRISQRCAKQQQLGKKIYSYRVTKDDAEWAYNRVIGDPTGENREYFDLSLLEFQNKFTDALSNLLKKGFLDIQAGLTKDITEETGTAAISPRGPSLRSFKVGSKRESSVCFPHASFLFQVIDNPITKQFFDKCVSSFDQLVFTKGRGGKQNANVRNASTTKDPAAIVIASKYVYGGLPAANIEVEILQIGNLIAEFQRKIIEEHFCQDGFKVTFHCNLLHTVVAAINNALYGTHNDSSALLCSEEKDYCHVAEDLWLPKRKDLQIMSLVLSNCKDKHSTNLIYTEGADDDSKKRKFLCKIPLGSCCLHFQGAGSQLPQFCHKVERTPGSRSDGKTWRLHCTMRFTLDPKTSPVEVDRRIQRDLNNQQTWETIADYDRVGVLSQTTSYYTAAEEDNEPSAGEKKRKAARDISDRDVDETAPHRALQTQVSAKGKLDSFLDLRTAPYTDRYPSVPKSMIDAMGIYRPRHIVRLGGSMAEELSAAPTLKTLFDQKRLVRLETATQSTIPLLHEVSRVLEDKGEVREFPVPGHYYNLSNISGDAGVKHDRAHPILSRKDNTDRVIIITQSYKNEAKGIMRYLQRLNDHKEEDDFFTGDFEGNIILHGSGGSPDVSGSFAPSAATASKDDPQITLPLHQPMESPMNIELQRMVWKDEVVTIYVNEAVFCGDNSNDDVTNYEESFGIVDSTADCGTCHKRQGPQFPALCAKNDPQKVRCLGTFVCSEFKIAKTKQEVVISEHKHERQGKQVYARYKLVKHVEVTFTPFMTNEDFKQLRFPGTDGNMRDSFQMVTIPYQCPHRIETEIGIGEGQQAASLESGKALFRSDVMQDFISSGGLSRYTTSVNADNGLDSADACKSESDNFDVDGEERGGSDNSDVDVDEDVKLPPNDDSARNCVKHSMSASVAEIISAVVLNNYSGALRFSRTECITAIDGKDYATPLKDDSLPALFRLHPTPMSNRALDVVTVEQRRSAIEDGLFDKCDTDPSERIKIGSVGSHLHREHLLDVLFKAVVFRFTGRPNPFRIYSMKRGKKFVLPSCDDLDDFLDFMETTIDPTSKNQTMSQWHSQQHLESIPKETKTMAGFKLFARRVKELLPTTLE